MHVYEEKTVDRNVFIGVSPQRYLLEDDLGHLRERAVIRPLEQLRPGAS